MKTFTLTLQRTDYAESSVSDIASDRFSRDIVFSPGCGFAVVLAAICGRHNYTSHKTPEAAALKSINHGTISNKIIDRAGYEYKVCNGALVANNTLAK